MENAGRGPEGRRTPGRRAWQIFGHRILSENPLLIALLGLYPVVAACHGLKCSELSCLAAWPPRGSPGSAVGGKIPLWAASGCGVGLQCGADPARRRATDG